MNRQARRERRRGYQMKNDARSRITRKTAKERANARRGNTSQHGRDKRAARRAQVTGNFALFMGGGQ